MNQYFICDLQDKTIAHVPNILALRRDKSDVHKKKYVKQHVQRFKILNVSHSKRTSLRF